MFSKFDTYGYLLNHITGFVLFCWFSFFQLQTNHTIRRWSIRTISSRWKWFKSTSYYW